MSALSTDRLAQLAALFVKHDAQLHRVVGRRVAAQPATVADACSYAWTQLLKAEHVDLTLPCGPLAWLTRTAVREAWRLNELEWRATPLSHDDLDAIANADKTVTVISRVSEPALRIIGAHGEVIAEHRRVPAGAGQTVRSTEHTALLEAAVLAAFTTKDACRRKPNLPPSDRALAELARLRGLDPEGARVISLADYATLAEVAAR